MLVLCVMHCFPPCFSVSFPGGSGFLKTIGCLQSSQNDGFHVGISTLLLVEDVDASDVA